MTPAATASELRQHLAACPACAESLRRASELVSSLRAGLRWQPPEELLRDTHRNIMQAVAEIERKKAVRRESPLWYAAALAASFLTGLCLWWALSSHPAAQSPVASAPINRTSEPQPHITPAPSGDAGT